jgi:hypothetical protein
MLLLAAVPACVAVPVRDDTCTPGEIDGILLRIDRRAESERALQLLTQLTDHDVAEPVAAVYEFHFARNKPTFYYVAGRGHVDCAGLLEEIVRVFGGAVRPAVTPVAHEHDGVTFLCLPFDRGRGLVALTAACVFDDGTLAGYGVRTDGGDVADTLAYTREARRAHLAHGPSACADRGRLEALAAPPTEVDGIAREIVAAVHAYACGRLADWYQAGAEEVFRREITPDLLLGTPDAVERVCFVLGTLPYPQSETMRIDVASTSERRTVLHLSAPDLLSRLAGDARTKLVLVREGETWRIDGGWALGEVYDLALRMRMTEESSRLQSYRRMTGTFSADAAEVGRVTGGRVGFESGLATATSAAGGLHVATVRDERACVSARSRSGRYFLMRIDATGGLSAGGSDAPWTECPASPLTGDWKSVPG